MAQMRTYLELARAGGVTRTDGNFNACIDAAVADALAVAKATRDETVERYRLALDDLRTELSKTVRQADRESALERRRRRALLQELEQVKAEVEAATRAKREAQAEIARLNAAHRDYVATAKTGLMKAVEQIERLQAERNRLATERDQDRDALKRLMSARRRPTKARR